MSTTILIKGASFSNKGAQSMLFTTISSIRKKYPNSHIIFGNSRNTSVLNDNFSFDEVYYNANDDNSVSKILKKVDLIIDISGFALGKKWGINTSRRYLQNIELAKIYGIPIILMPQSFGSFDFGEHQAEIDELMSKYMSYPVKIFAREHEGFDYLTKDYNLQNVNWHPDLVLCSQHVEPSDIYVNVPTFSVPKVEEKSCVAIIPNLRSFDHGHPIHTLQVFCKQLPD